MILLSLYELSPLHSCFFQTYENYGFSTHLLCPMKMQKSTEKGFSHEDYEFLREVMVPPFFSLPQVYLSTNEKTTKIYPSIFKPMKKKSEIIQSI